MPANPTATRIIPSTCKSCRHFTIDALLYPKHAAVGLGHCGLSKRDKSVFMFESKTCGLYDATDRRKAYLADMAAPKLPTL